MKTLKMFLWFVINAVGVGAVIAGQITHKEIEWLNNLSWFIAWTFVLIELILAIGISQLNSTMDKLLAGGGPVKRKESCLETLKVISDRNFAKRFFILLHRLLDLVMLVVLACAGWFVSAFVYLLCAHAITPTTRVSVEKKYKKYVEGMSTTVDA